MPPPVPVHKGVKYRADIDGLRAVAVFLVLLYHLGTPVYGGFIGVDVFFVISGYLISSVVIADFAADRFSIANFYERRIRRIFPALLVVMGVTTILTLRFFIPQENEAFGRSQLAALFSVSNFLFWKQSGYFDNPSTIKPLLHTWSLGVEEQFYIVFPLLLMLIRRLCPQRMRVILCSLTLVSFAAAAVIVRRDPTTAFFFAPLRAWELLLGTIVSQRYLPAFNGRYLRNAASAAGLLLILLPGHYYTETTRFPGVSALPPCLGAALIIAAGETGSSAVGALLSWRPIVFLGWISYSLYLWHWPLLVFQKTGSLLFKKADMTSADKVIFCLIAVAISSLSWAWVEQPFRKGRFRPGRRALLQITGAASGLVACASLALIFFHGFPDRFPADAQRVAAYADFDRTASTREGICFLDGHSKLASFNQETCLHQQAGRKGILLLGDSHAAQLLPGLQAVFPDRDILQADVAGCRPLVVEARDTSQECQGLNSFLFNNYLPNHHVDLLILTGDWMAGDMDRLTQTIDYLHAHHLPAVLIGPTIEYDQAMPRMLAIALRKGDVTQVAQHRLTAPLQLDRTMARLARTRWGIPYISIYQDLCTPDCPLYAAPGVPLLFDTNHFTPQAAIVLARRMVADKQLQ